MALRGGDERAGFRLWNRGAPGVISDLKREFTKLVAAFILMLAR